jgi:hypothetical protein
MSEQSQSPVARLRKHLHVLDRRPGYAEIAATMALFLASTTTAYAAATIGTADIKDGAVTHAKLASDAVKTGNVAANTITLADIKGIDAKGFVTFTIVGQHCSTIALGTGGAVAGQAGFLSWTGTPPAGIVLGPMQFLDSHASVVLCNVSTSTVSVSNAGVRIITFS